jgi:hypothetical protein
MEVCAVCVENLFHLSDSLGQKKVFSIALEVGSKFASKANVPTDRLATAARKGGYTRG